MLRLHRNHRRAGYLVLRSFSADKGVLRNTYLAHTKGGGYAFRFTFFCFLTAASTLHRKNF